MIIGKKLSRAIMNSSCKAAKRGLLIRELNHSGIVLHIFLILKWMHIS